MPKLRLGNSLLQPYLLRLTINDFYLQILESSSFPDFYYAQNEVLALREGK